MTLKDTHTQRDQKQLLDHVLESMMVLAKDPWTNVNTPKEQTEILIRFTRCLSQCIDKNIQLIEFLGDLNDSLIELKDIKPHVGATAEEIKYYGEVSKTLRLIEPVSLSELVAFDRYLRMILAPANQEKADFQNRLISRKRTQSEDVSNLKMRIKEQDKVIKLLTKYIKRHLRAQN